MVHEPTDEELTAFIVGILSNLDERLREPEVIADAIAANRELWVALYHASSGLDSPA